MPDVVDPKTPAFVKRPGEDRRQTFNLAPAIPAGATISGQEVVCTKLGRVTPADDIVPTSKAASGARVQATFPGGTDEEDYLVTVTGALSTGGTVKEFFLLRCRDAMVPES
jgi:hypothetical protein